jgi:hypothetical protein
MLKSYSLGGKMNSKEYYKDLVESIFKQNLNLKIDDRKNNCIGALNYENNFETFKINFIERLKRLYNFYKNDPLIINKILVALKNIGEEEGYSWSGPYSELVTLDYWIQYDNILNINYQIKDTKTLYNKSLAKIAGQKEVDIDISLDLSSFKIYMDVKSFKPIYLEIIDSIIEKVKKITINKDYMIGIDDLYDVDYLQMKKDFTTEFKTGNLQRYLKEKIESREIYCDYTLNSGKTIKFRIAYYKNNGNTVLSTTRIMDPYRLAKDYRFRIIDYYNKLLKNKPCFLVFVRNPWFNNEISDFCEFDQLFYRSFARRVFIELTNNKEKLENYFPNFLGKKTRIKDIAKLISGIVFIDDNSITKQDQDLYKVFIFTNPNATNKRVKRFDFDILRWSHFAKQPTVIDDFEYDNY